MSSYGDETNIPPLDEAISRLANHHTGGLAMKVNREMQKDGTERVRFDIGKDPSITRHYPAAPLRCHAVDDVESLVAYAKEYGDSNHSVLFVDENGVNLVIDNNQDADTLEEVQPETVKLHFQYSAELQGWSHLISRDFDHKTVLGKLRKLAHTLDSPEILASMRDASFRGEIISESVESPDERSVGYLFKTSRGEKLAKFPSSIAAHMPILQEDYESATLWPQFQFELDIELPNKPDGSVSFILSCPEWTIMIQRRIAEEVDKLKEALDGWLIVRGRPNFVERRAILIDGEGLVRKFTE